MRARVFHTTSTDLLLYNLLSVHIVVHGWKYEPLLFNLLFNYWGCLEWAVVIATGINDWQLCSICFFRVINIGGQRCQHLLVPQWVFLDWILWWQFLLLEIFWLGNLRTPCILITRSVLISCFILRSYIATQYWLSTWWLILLWLDILTIIIKWPFLLQYLVVFMIWIILHSLLQRVVSGLRL